MPRLFTTHIDQAPVDVPVFSGLSTKGEIKSKALVGAAEQPLHLWAHEMAPGAELIWSKPGFGHVVYIWKGGVNSAGEQLDAGAAVAVEHGGESTVRAGAEGATLIHFTSNESAAEAPERAGGHVHLAPEKRALHWTHEEMGLEQDLYAGGDCPTCKLWLHRAEIAATGSHVGPHWHTEDELIFFTEGSAILGQNELGAGGAIAVSKNSVYSFNHGADGLTLINFRIGDPVAWVRQRGGKPALAFHERALFGEWDSVRAQA